jgi:hypothetical protein
MWRSSGLGWTVTPCAPARITVFADSITLGIPISRWFRSSAILFRLTLNFVIFVLAYDYIAMGVCFKQYYIAKIAMVI